MVDGMIDERAELVRRHGPRSGKANTIAVHISTIKERLILAFGDVPVADLTRSMLNEWARKQKVLARRGPEKGREATPGQSTIGSWNHSLQKVLDRAVEKGWITEDDKPAISQKGFEKAKPNPTMFRNVVAALRDHMTDAWVAEGGGREWEQEASVEVRYLLRAYIALATTTGIRAGEELELILPRQVVFKMEGGREIISIPILADQGRYKIERTAIVYMNDVFGASRVLRDLLRWRQERWRCAETNAKDAPLFAIPSTGRCPDFSRPFKRLLVDVGRETGTDILVDPKTGMELVPYSARHYYATQAVLRGWAYERLEKLMGTSADMLRRHYDHADILSHAAELSGHGERSFQERVDALADRAIARGVRAPVVLDEQYDGWLDDRQMDDQPCLDIGRSPGAAD